MISRILALAIAIFFFAPALSAEEYRRIYLTFTGDLMAHTPNFSVRPFDYIYDGIRHILQKDDLSFVNLETPVDDSAPFASYPLFNVHSEYVEAAINAGFDVFSLANNHTADRGVRGIKQTEAAMKSLRDRSIAKHGKDVFFAGLRVDGSATPYRYRMEQMQIRGVKIGFISVAEIVNIPSRTDWVQSVYYRNQRAADDFIQFIQEQRPFVDVLILSYHWGSEYMTRQDPASAAFTRRLVGAGVDVLWGHHPHVLQPWYMLSSPRGDALVLPSMGNFVSGQAWFLGPRDSRRSDAKKGDSALFGIRLAVRDDGRVVIERTHPVLISHRTTEKGGVEVRTYQDLVRTLDSSWRDFYLDRWSIMGEFYQGSAWAGAESGIQRMIPLRNTPR